MQLARPTGTRSSIRVFTGTRLPAPLILVFAAESASYVNESNHLRERAAEMRASSKELKDNNTAAAIMRLADLYDLVESQTLVAVGRRDPMIESMSLASCQRATLLVTKIHRRKQKKAHPAIVAWLVHWPIIGVVAFIVLVTGY